jgi:UPF0716 protein FxsA
MWTIVALMAAPFVEIALFVVVGARIGVLATLALVVLSAVAGSALLRATGLRALLEAGRMAERGADAPQAAVDAALAVLAAVLLILPGFASDAAGLALLVPPLRAAAARWLAPRFGTVVVVRGFGVRGAWETAARDAGRPPDDAAIEVEYREIDPDPSDRGRPPR